MPIPTRVLVTGANSGLGFEAAAQLAEAGAESIVLAARSQEKADAARAALQERTGRDVFATVVVDVADVASSRDAAATLVAAGEPFDGLLLNAGMVAADLERTREGIELSFASSLVGHHEITKALIDAGTLRDGATVILVGSEAANNDLPAMMGMTVPDYALNGEATPEKFKAALMADARGEAEPFNGNVQYALTKTVSSWWSGAMQRRYRDRFTFLTVSPGSNMSTAAGRNARGMMKVIIAVMSRVGPLMGMSTKTPVGAKRYVDSFANSATLVGGGTYTSRPKKVTGDVARRQEPHLVDPVRQDQALEVLDDLTRVTV